MSTTTSTHELLHRLVDVLSTDDAAAAARVLEAMAWRADPAATAAALAPVDDEPTSDADRAALAERAARTPDAYRSLDAVLGELEAGDSAAA